MEGEKMFGKIQKKMLAELLKNDGRKVAGGWQIGIDKGDADKVYITDGHFMLWLDKKHIYVKADASENNIDATSIMRGYADAHVLYRYDGEMKKINDGRTVVVLRSASDDCPDIWLDKKYFDLFDEPKALAPMSFMGDGMPSHMVYIACAGDCVGAICPIKY